MELIPIVAALPGAVLALLLSALPAAAPVGVAAAATGAPDVTYVVTAADSSSASAVAATVDAHGGDVTAVLPSVDAVVATMDAAGARRVAAAPGVDGVERNTTFHLLDVAPSAAAPSASAPSAAGTTQRPAPWHLDRLDQASLPLDGAYAAASTGAGVTAYELDSGIRATHADLGGRVAPGFDATAPVGTTGSTDDCVGHGTHVAGLIGGATAGVAKEVTLVPVRVIDCSGTGTLAQVLAGIDWVTAHHARGAPAVANMSVGGPVSAALDHAVAASVATGITYVVAAGNDSGDACDDSPARVPEVLTVGATDSSDELTSYSDAGPCVDVFAPGDEVVSDWNTSDTALARVSGTSMAAPLVAGDAALVLARHPSAAPAQVAAVVTAEANDGVVTDPDDPGHTDPDVAGSPNRLLATSATAGSGQPVQVVGGTAALGSPLLRDLGAATGRDLVRLAGDDRYDTSAAASAATFAPRAGRVFLAVGATFPDALAAAAAAGAAKAPVLLVAPGELPGSVADELVRLAPARVTAVGGTSAVPDAVLDQVRRLTGASVDRLAGADRYATAAAVSAATSPAAPATVYLASGEAFPDAVSASTAAARTGSPLLLTARGALPEPTRVELARLHPARVVVVGGAAAIGPQVAAAAASAAGGAALATLAGQTRYQTAAAVLGSQGAPSSLSVATGLDFPDALVGAAAAASTGGSLVIVPPGGVPDDLRAALAAATG